MKRQFTSMMVAVSLCVWAAAPSFATSSCLEAIFIKYDGDIAKMKSDQSYNACAASLLAARQQITESIQKNAKASASVAKPKGSEKQSTPPVVTSSLVSITPLLRHDFTDIWLFSDAGPVDQAQGATFSYTSDAIAHNDSWALHGMAAVIIKYAGNYGQGNAPGLLGFSFAPYVTIDRLKNSSPKLAKSNSDTFTGGGSAEVGLDMLGGQHYFRVRGAAVSDQIANKTSGSAVADWIPVYRNLNIGSPSAIPFVYPIIYRFSPEIKARYDALPTLDHPTVKDYEWRAGPQLTLVYQLLQSDPVPDFLQRLSGQTSYIWLASDNGRRFRWFETSLTYKIDDVGHVGLTGSYKKGQAEDTGATADIYTVGLSAKW